MNKILIRVSNRCPAAQALTFDILNMLNVKIEGQDTFGDNVYDVKGNFLMVDIECATAKWGTDNEIVIKWTKDNQVFNTLNLDHRVFHIIKEVNAENE